jgi:4'-phosphopantetheinyl transferase EntD
MGEAHEENTQQLTGVLKSIPALFPFFVSVAGRYFSESIFLPKSECLRLSKEPKMSHGRIAEFSAGRIAAQEALILSGLLDAAFLESHVLGFPLWPNQYTGSIAHKGRFAIAVVSKTVDAISIGIDIEKFQPSDSRLTKRIASEKELDRGPKISLLEKTTLIFSIKEAYFKYFSPIAQSRDLDFRDLEIAWAEEPGAFAISLLSDKFQKAGLPSAAGSFLIQGDLLITTAFPNSSI